MIIAVDGPAGAGKSTVAKKVANALNIIYIDTGAMYRAAAYKSIITSTNIYDSVGLTKMLDTTSVDFVNNDIILDDININDKIRTPEISKLASDISAIKEVREKLVDLQRKMGESKSVIMDGRDIGTNVFPNAEYKFFINASAEERASRRLKELLEKGEEVQYSEVLEEIKTRDNNDSTRELNPLVRADDAVLIDTTHLSIEEAVTSVMDLIKKGK